MRRRAALGLLAAGIATIGIVLAIAPPDAGAQEPTRRGRALEERLLAPCCWTQTLDAHDSPESRALRAEIDRRLAAGETTSAIEQDLVARYGERIRAVPRAGFLDPIGLGVLALLLGTAIALVAIGRRWAHRARLEAASTEAAPTVAADAALDARLEAELERLSEA